MRDHRHPCLPPSSLLGCGAESQLALALNLNLNTVPSPLSLPPPPPPSLEKSRVGYEQLSHYGSLPYEALFQGYFFNISAARWVGSWMTPSPHQCSKVGG